MSNILKKENTYKYLMQNDNEDEILKLISSEKINVLLDVGALMLHLSNKQVAKKWLDLTNNEIESAIFFENNDLVVIEKNSNLQMNSFETSNYRYNLKKCIIYLDDIHTRGTDLKIPINTTAAVTLGKGLDKDRLFQACMRMRMLGDGHNVKFLACNEVNCEISNNMPTNAHITSKDVLQWAINNSIKIIKNGSIYWAHQGLSYYLKRASYENYVSRMDLKNYFQTCIESNSTKLSFLYGNSRIEHLIIDIIKNQSSRLLKIFQDHKMDSVEFELNTEKISRKLSKQIPNLKKFDQLLDEEMELEIEKEVTKINFNYTRIF